MYHDIMIVTSISATPQSPQTIQTLQISPAACDGRDEGRGRSCSPARGLVRCSGIHVLLIFYDLFIDIVLMVIMSKDRYLGSVDCASKDLQRLSR